MWRRKNKTVPETRKSGHSSWLISNSSERRGDKCRRWVLGMGRMKRNIGSSRKEGEERCSLTLSALGMLLLLFYVTACGLTLLFPSSSAMAAPWSCLCDLHRRDAPTMSLAAIPSPCLGKTCCMCPSCTMWTRLGPVLALGEPSTRVPASCMGHQWHCVPWGFVSK